MPFLVRVRKQGIGNNKAGGETGCKRTPVSEVLLLASQGKSCTLLPELGKVLRLGC